MADRRYDLHELFCGILGTRNVYFQPPESLKLKYPAIVYSRANVVIRHANDGVYLLHKMYSVTLIDQNPDSEYVDKLLKLPLCRFNRHYKSDNLNHDVFTLYY